MEVTQWKDFDFCKTESKMKDQSEKQTDSISVPLCPSDYDNNTSAADNTRMRSHFKAFRQTKIPQWIARKPCRFVSQVSRNDFDWYPLFKKLLMDSSSAWSAVELLSHLLLLLLDCICLYL